MQLGTFLLRGDTEYWWETVRQRYANQEVTWAEFQNAFHETYIPAWEHEQKVHEFIELTHGAKTVA